MIGRTLLVLACTLFASNAWANVTIYVNSYDASASNIYYWGDGMQGTNWPGVLINTLEPETIDGVLWYKKTFENVDKVSCLFNEKDNNNNKTEDIVDLQGTKHLRYNGGSGYYIFENTTWRVAGTTNNHSGEGDPIFGTSWNTGLAANVMSHTEHYSIFTWTSAPVELAANSSVAFKVVRDGNDYIPSGNNNDVICSVSEAGTYVLKVTYTLNTSAPVGEFIKVLKEDATNFPDSEFLLYVSSLNINHMVSGYWTPAELAQVTSMDCSNQGISSLKGIENFAALTTLNCSGNHLSSIDLSHNAVTDLTAGGQTVAYASGIVERNKGNICYIWLNQFVNGLPSVAQSEFDMSRVTWGTGCHTGSSTGTNENPGPTDILIVDETSNNAGSFKYNYATTLSKAFDSSMDVTVSWSGTSPSTGINTISAGKGEVKAVRYYNLMGVESATPFDGVNIVVKEFNDGTRETSKVVK